ncbi:hypothetical protein HUX88_02810 [Duganella sp. BJB1802]|uniref:hypothetical protein n=1 Tax=Duganella sp. BJB1802 TaxID=2744575 RepID=UPI001592CE13|nr:hypothetical protein [Duganella sp. BJB1802]NVD69489.1 hypothetical protein [Duganella sp. BJB1802]
MSIRNFRFRENEQFASWIDEKTAVSLGDVRRAVFDADQDLVVAIGASSAATLKVYGPQGLLMELEAPDNSDFQYLLSDKNRGTLVVCSEKNSKGDVLDWYYKIDLLNRSLVKDGRSY